MPLRDDAPEKGSVVDRLHHGARLGAAGLVAGLVAGAVAGLGSRLVMFGVRVANPSHNGALTHADSEVGRVTLDGTLSLAIEGMFYGIAGALVYLVVRRWLPSGLLAKGLAFGLGLLVVAGPAVIDGNYEYFRYTSAMASVGLFASLYLLYGIVLAPLTERLGHGTAGPPRRAIVAWAGYLGLGALLLWSLARDLVVARDVFHLFG